jgi:hypothetical protein
MAKTALLRFIISDNEKVVAPANKIASNKIGRIPVSKEL